MESGQKKQNNEKMETEGEREAEQANWRARKQTRRANVHTKQKCTEMDREGGITKRERERNQFRVGKVEIRGNTKTFEKVVRRELRIRPVNFFSSGSIITVKYPASRKSDETSVCS